MLSIIVAILSLVCVILANACPTKHCFNGGTCYMTGNTYECKCSAWFTGRHCDRINLNYRFDNTPTTTVTSRCRDNSFICHRNGCSDDIYRQLCPASCGQCQSVRLPINTTVQPTIKTQTSTTETAMTVAPIVTVNRCENSPFVRCNDLKLCSTSSWASYCPVTCGKCTKATSQLLPFNCVDSRLVHCYQPNICSKSIGRLCRQTCGHCGMALTTQKTTQGTTTDWLLIGQKLTTTDWLFIPNNKP